MAILGILSIYIANSPGILLAGLLALIIGIVQILADLGWISIVKINKKLSTWNEAYKIVIEQREQKLFLFPIYIDILFITISLGTILTLGL
jgi:predicted acyltransferase